MGFRSPDYNSLTGEWWRPRDDGEALTGIFLGCDTRPSRFGGDQTFFGIRIQGGAERRVPVNALLARAFASAKVAVGSGVKITFTGMKGNARGYEVVAMKPDDALIASSKQ
jgi:hypothetical protein